MLPRNRRCGAALGTCTVLCVLFSSGAIATSRRSEGPRLTSPATQRRTIAKLERDLVGGPGDEVLEVVMLDGRQYEDLSGWCGRGPKYEGSFVVELHRTDGTTERLPLEGVWFFRDEEWRPEISDYNGDGAWDFNLGQYGSCNGWRYRLFTVTGSGEIRPLRVAERDWVPVSAWDNSTDRITPTGTGFRACWYNNAEGHLLTEYRWVADRQRFVVADEHRVTGCTVRQNRREPRTSQPSIDRYGP